MIYEGLHYTWDGEASAATVSCRHCRVDVASDRARACPPDAAYSGPPYVAFEADRRMPGRQPDQFIVANARENARFLREAAADQPRCP